MEALKAAPRPQMAARQLELDLGAGVGPSGPLPITSSRMGVLLEALEHAYRVPGLGRATGGDEVFLQLVLARIIEPTSKLDSLRVLEEAGAAPAGYARPSVFTPLSPGGGRSHTGREIPASRISAQLWPVNRAMVSSAL